LVVLFKLRHLYFLRISSSLLFFNCGGMSNFELEMAAPFFLRSELDEVSKDSLIMAEDLLRNSGTRKIHIRFFS
jgi:hypothetical protein